MDSAGNFSGSAGGTINITGGGKLVIPTAAVTDAGGAAYNGTVNVAMTWIDPTAPNLSSIVMGDLRGVTTTGVERGLTTYGMLGVELTGAGGQAFAKGDIDGMTANYDDNVLYTWSSGDSLRGKKAVADYYKGRWALIDSFSYSDQILLPIMARVQQSNAAPPGKWVLAWAFAHVKYKNGKKT